jgi:hypothetical protein
MAAENLHCSGFQLLPELLWRPADDAMIGGVQQGEPLSGDRHKRHAPQVNGERLVLSHASRLVAGERTPGGFGPTQGWLVV